MEILSDSVWQMTLGERAAMEGVLAQRKPRLAIGIGTAAGGSLQRVEAGAGEVHAYELRYYARDRRGYAERHFPHWEIHTNFCPTL